MTTRVVTVEYVTYDTKDEAVDAVWQSLRDQAAGMVRQCPHCGQWFRQNGKQVYCQPECARLTHWDRFKVHRPPRDHKAEYAARKSVPPSCPLPA